MPKLLLHYRFVVLALIALSLFVQRAAVTNGFFADDYAQLSMLEGTYPLRRAAYDLFDFSNGTRAEGQHLIDVGFYPWWVDPNVRIAMLRPLASFMIAFDHALFGVAALPYHLHSALWWAGMIGMIALLYRRFLALPYAIVAIALVAVDEAHAVALAWVCNRSVFICSALGIVSLLAYARFRSGDGARWLGIAALSFCVALGFGEYAVCMLAYLVAYEVVIGSGAWSRRLGFLSVFFIPTVVFFGVRGWLGASMHDSGVYADPFADPRAFAHAVATRLPVLLGDLVFAVRADFYTFGGPFLHDLFKRGLIPERWVHDPDAWRALQISLGVLAGALLWLLSRVWLRGERHRHARWLLLGSVFALLPVCGSFPSSRITIMAQIGFAPLLAAGIIDGLSKLRIDSSHRLQGLGAGSLAMFIAVYHVVLPIRSLRRESVEVHDGTVLVREAVLNMHVDEASLPSRDVILLNAPEGGTSMYLPMTRRLYGRTTPHSYLTLSHVKAPYRLARVGANALTISYDGTHTLLETAPEQLLRSPKRPFHVQDRVHAGPLTATILSLFEGRPQRILFVFDRPLEDRSLLFMLPTERGLREFHVPSFGASVEVPPPVLPRVRSALSQLLGET